MRLRAAVLAAIVASLGACGEEGVPTGNIVAPKERYIRQADALCGDFRDAVMSAEFAARHASAAKKAKLRRQLARLAAETQRKIEAIPRPEEDGALLERYISLSSKRKPTEAASPELRRVADRYGFDSCPI